MRDMLIIGTYYEININDAKYITSWLSSLKIKIYDSYTDFDNYIFFRDDGRFHFNKNNDSSFIFKTYEELLNIGLRDFMLLEQAKERYLIGTKFHPAHIDEQSTYCFITNNLFNILDGQVYSLTDENKVSSKESKYGNTTYNRLVYYNGKWANIKVEEKISEIKVEEKICNIGRRVECINNYNNNQSGVVMNESINHIFTVKLDYNRGSCMPYSPFSVEYSPQCKFIDDTVKVTNVELLPNVSINGDKSQESIIRANQLIEEAIQRGYIENTSFIDLDNANTSTISENIYVYYTKEDYLYVNIKKERGTNTQRIYCKDKWAIIVENKKTIKEKAIEGGAWHVICNKENLEVCSQWRFGDQNLNVCLINKIVGNFMNEKGNFSKQHNAINGDNVNFGRKISTEEFYEKIGYSRLYTPLKNLDITVGTGLSTQDKTINQVINEYYQVPELITSKSSLFEEKTYIIPIQNIGLIQKTTIFYF